MKNKYLIQVLISILFMVFFTYGIGVNVLGAFILTGMVWAVRWMLKLFINK